MSGPQVAPIQKIQYQAIPDKINPADWRVEGIDYEREGEVYVAIFSGPFARERATEYASFLNGD
jgi:hypothetical protein